MDALHAAAQKDKSRSCEGPELQSAHVSTPTHNHSSQNHLKGFALTTAFIADEVLCKPWISRKVCARTVLVLLQISVTASKTTLQH